MPVDQHDPQVMVWVAIAYFGYVFYIFDRMVRVGQRPKKRGKGMTKGILVSETETAEVYQRVVKEIYVPSIERLFPGVRYSPPSSS